MHANIAYATLDMDRYEQIVADIAELITHYQGMPGFKGGNWFEPIDGRGLAVTLWDDEACARTAALPSGTSPVQGMVIDRVETRRVLLAT